jgi:hypothetical protein
MRVCAREHLRFGAVTDLKLIDGIHIDMDRLKKGEVK